MTPAEIAQHGLILRATVGSSAHGLHIAGTDDRDEMGVYHGPGANAALGYDVEELVVTP